MTSPRLTLPGLTVWALSALLVLGAVAGCGQPTSPTGAAGPTAVASSTTTAPTATATATSTATATARAHGVRLDASVGVGFPEQPAGPGMRKRPGVVVTYTLTRVGTPGTVADLVAYDVVPDSLGSATLPAGVDLEHAWVYADGPTVRISKQGFAPGPSVTFVAAPTMGVRPIPADAPLTGRAYAVTPPELAVPGPEFSAPRSPIAPGASSFSFCVQVGEKVPGMRPSGIEGVLQAAVRAPEGDELVCTAAVTLATP